MFGVVLSFLVATAVGLPTIALLTLAQRQLSKLSVASFSLLSLLFVSRPNTQGYELENTEIQSALVPRRANRSTRRKIYMLRNRMQLRNRPIRSSFLSQPPSMQSLRVATTIVVLAIAAPITTACKHEVVLTASGNLSDEKTGGRLFLVNDTIQRPISQSLTPLCIFLVSEHNEPLAVLRIDFEQTRLVCNERVQTFTRDIIFDQFFLEDGGNHDCHETDSTRQISFQ